MTTLDVLDESFSAVFGCQNDKLTFGSLDMFLYCTEVKQFEENMFSQYFTRSFMSEEVMRHGMLLKGTEFFDNLHTMSISLHALFCLSPARKSLHHTGSDKQKLLTNLHMSALVCQHRTLHTDVARCSAGLRERTACSLFTSRVP